MYIILMSPSPWEKIEDTFTEKVSCNHENPYKIICRTHVNEHLIFNTPVEISRLRLISTGVLKRKCSFLSLKKEIID